MSRKTTAVIASLLASTAACGGSATDARDPSGEPAPTAPGFDGGAATDAAGAMDSGTNEGGSLGDGGQPSCSVSVTSPGPRAQIRPDDAWSFGAYEVLLVPRIASTTSTFEVVTASNGSACHLRRGTTKLADVPCSGTTAVRGAVLGAGAFDLELVVEGGPGGSATCKTQVTIGYPRPCKRGTIVTTHSGLRAVSQTISATLSRTFTYDTAGVQTSSKLTCTSCVPQETNTTLTYDVSGRSATALVTEQNRLLTYSYRPDGQVASVEDDIGQNGVDFRFTYQYATSGRLESVLEQNLIDAESRRHTFSYDGAGLVTSRTVTVVSGSPSTIGSTFTYDAAGNITVETPTSGPTRAYEYLCFP